MYARRDAYMIIFNSPKPKYDGFWAQLNEEWQHAFPEIEAWFPEAESWDALSSEEQNSLGLYIKQRLEVCALTLTLHLFLTLILL